MIGKEITHAVGMDWPSDVDLQYWIVFGNATAYTLYCTNSPRWYRIELMAQKKKSDTMATLPLRVMIFLVSTADDVDMLINSNVFFDFYFVR